MELKLSKIKHYVLSKLYIKERCDNIGKFNDFTGQKFGNWLVVERGEDYISPKGYKATTWLCECQCENKTKKVIRASILKNGSSKSCGCMTHQLNVRVNNLIGKTFGKLTVLERYYGNDIKNKRKKVVWLCECECGNTKPVIVDDLRSGKVQSCGCLKSVAEYEVEKYLKSLNVNYKSEFCIETCRDIVPLPFDFGIFNNQNNLMFLIELNGEYHYDLTGYDNAEEKLEYTINHDKIKKVFCKENGIDLLVIPYWDFKEKEKIIYNYLNKYNILKGEMF